MEPILLFESPLGANAHNTAVNYDGLVPKVALLAEKSTLLPSCDVYCRGQFDSRQYHVPDDRQKD